MTSRLVWLHPSPPPPVRFRHVISDTSLSPKSKTSYVNSPLREIWPDFYTENLFKFICRKEAGVEWKPIRKIMNTTFNSKILQSFVPIFNDKTKILLENLEKEVGECSFDVFKYTSNLTLDTICGEWKY